MTSRSERPEGGDEAVGPELTASPYDVYEGWRREHPVHWNPELHAWVVVDHDDAVTVLRDDRFSNAKAKVVRERYPDPAYRAVFDLVSHNLVNQDGDAHKRMRRLMSHAFQPAVVAGYAPRIEARANGLIDGLMAAGRVDFVADFAIPLPVMVIADIIGLEHPDPRELKRWCDDYTMIVNNLVGALATDDLDRAAISVPAFRTFLEGEVERIRRAPDDGLLSHLVQAQETGDRLSFEELMANCMMLLNAGNETTTSLLANGMLTLLRHPKEMQRLRDDPALIEPAIEELLRLETPLQMLGRIATAPVELRGQRIAAGDGVLVVLGAANRDARAFPEPARLDLARQPNHHLGFGSGIHICIGMQLARVEATIGFRQLLARLDPIEPEPGPVHYGRNRNMRCPMRLPLRVGTRGRTP